MTIHEIPGLEKYSGDILLTKINKNKKSFTGMY